MGLVRSTDNTRQHIYTPFVRGTRRLHPGKVSLASHASNSQLLTRQGRERKFLKGEGPFSRRHPLYIPSPLTATFPSSRKSATFVNRETFDAERRGSFRNISRSNTEYRRSFIEQCRACMDEGKGEQKKKSLERKRVLAPRAR